MNKLIDTFLPLERNLFFALNGSDSVLIDNAMWTFTGVLTWVPMMLFILYIVFRYQKLNEALFILIAIVLLIVLADQISSSIFKPFFKRLRATHHPDYMNIVDIVRDYRGGQYGFISGHATNSFAVAVFLSLLFKNRFVTISMMFWAALNSYSRIYLGVHFLSDIIAGFVIGMLIGLLVYEIYKKIRVQYFSIPSSLKGESIYSKRQGNLLGAVIISYIGLVILLSPFFSSFSHTVIPKSWF